MNGKHPAIWYTGVKKTSISSVGNLIVEGQRGEHEKRNSRKPRRYLFSEERREKMILHKNMWSYGYRYLSVDCVRVAGNKYLTAS